MEGAKAVRAVRVWMYSAVKSAGFPDRLEVGGKRKRGVRNDTQVFGLSIWKNAVAIY